MHVIAPRPTCAIAAACKLFCAVAMLVVSASAPAQSDRFVMSADAQEVTDTLTQLTWRRCAEGMGYRANTCTGQPSTYAHELAFARAKSEATASGKGWRLPNIKELSSLVDRSRSNPSINVAAFPSTPDGSFWSSSPFVSDSVRAWEVDFAEGAVAFNNRGLFFRVRLVRDTPR